MNATATTPVVMAMSGADPTGGAGIQADIETIASLGCHAAHPAQSIGLPGLFQTEHRLPGLKTCHSSLP